MNDSVALLQQVVSQGQWAYQPRGLKATEPAALAALALCANGMLDEAAPLASWLADLQTPAGSVGVTEDQETPAWPTSLAILAWQAHDQATGEATFADACQRALDWSLQTQGKVLAKRRQIGHDTTILGWSWAADTHSWLEPTCFFVLALKAMGYDQHMRTRSGVQMIVDRLHETGGCNYGNTVVLGQSTLPHVQPTGLAMLAVANEPTDDPRIARSLDYLERAVTEPVATASLCYALLGLTAHGRRPSNASALLERAFQTDSAHDTHDCYKLALLCLAASADLAWLPRQQNSLASAAANA